MSCRNRPRCPGRTPAGRRSRSLRCAGLNSTRMKKSPVSVSSNCCASRMLNPPSNSAAETLATIPGRLMQERVRMRRTLDIEAPFGRPAIGRRRRPLATGNSGTSASLAPRSVRFRARRKDIPLPGAGNSRANTSILDPFLPGSGRKRVGSLRFSLPAGNPAVSGLRAADEFLDRRQHPLDDDRHACRRRMHLRPAG